MWSFRKEVHKLSNTFLFSGGGGIPCDDDLAFSSPSGAGTYYIDVNIGTSTGLVVLEYDAGNIPDRFEIIYDGATVADSEYVGGYLTGNPPNANKNLWGDTGNFVGSVYNNIPDKEWDGAAFIPLGPVTNHTIVQPDIAPFGFTAGAGAISFIKTTASPSIMRVKVTSVVANTGWSISTHCVVPVPTASFNLDSYNVDGCTTCATLTVTVPPGTTKRVEFESSNPGSFPPYSSNTSLCSGTGTVVTNDMVEVITSSKTYKFGIDKTLGTQTLNTTTTVTVVDDATNDLEDVYVLGRRHNGVTC